MPKGKRAPTRRDPLPDDFDSLESFWDFWDTHSSADYEDAMEESDLRINMCGSKTLCPLARDVVEDVRAYARREGLSTETLVNLWLRQKMTELAHAGSR